MKSCFLFGHADCPQDIQAKIIASVEQHYTQYGIRQFYVGNRGNFDRLAATALRLMKKQHTDMELYLLIAYHPGERRVDLLRDFDGSFYPPIENVPKPFRIVSANQYMADQADRFICYVNHIGNTRDLLDYTCRRRSDDRIDNIAMKYGTDKMT